jgi:hypothetical protein
MAVSNRVASLILGLADAAHDKEIETFQQCFSAGWPGAAAAFSGRY